MFAFISGNGEDEDWNLHADTLMDGFSSDPLETPTRNISVGDSPLSPIPRPPSAGSQPKSVFILIILLSILTFYLNDYFHLVQPRTRRQRTLSQSAASKAAATTTMVG